MRRPRTALSTKPAIGSTSSSNISACSVEPASATPAVASWRLAEEDAGHHYSRIDAYSSTSGVLRLR